MERPPEDHLRVHFSGSWSDKAQSRLLRAVRAFDDRHGLGEPSPHVGRPWVAVKHDMEARTILFVSRTGMKRPFSGATVDEIIALLQSDSLPGQPLL
ncbi:hypothetical protein CRI94_15685 [Longibacter salinarum]|uniref:Uncharacterized protein n=1 Tax=Longibacter salinarum TaxID=1850348 RepID=A0A2A8CU91_9BACT|nr:hypothetical protein [Longibacter salinarum]PEN11472.1 hypothetical protein CRI94_15685 [Longibacter salinarum]